MITRVHATPWVGQHVVVRTHEGAVHYGILHSVTQEGIYLRPIRGATSLTTTETEQQPLLLGTASPEETDVEQAWFPFFFFPFLALAWLGPWAWW